MSRTELKAGIRSLVEALAERHPDDGWRGVRHLLDFDEVEEAMDIVVATLVRDNVAITSTQHDRVRELTGAFEMDAHDRSIYRYLGDAEMLDRMNVVDGPS